MILSYRILYILLIREQSGVLSCSVRIHGLSRNQCVEEGMAPFIVTPNNPLCRVFTSITIIQFHFWDLEVLVSKREILRTVVLWNRSLALLLYLFEFLLPLHQQAKKGVDLRGGWSWLPRGNSTDTRKCEQRGPFLEPRGILCDNS